MVTLSLTASALPGPGASTEDASTCSVEAVLAPSCEVTMPCSGAGPGSQGEFPPCSDISTTWVGSFDGAAVAATKPGRVDLTREWLAADGTVLLAVSWTCTWEGAFPLDFAAASVLELLGAWDGHCGVSSSGSGPASDVVAARLKGDLSADAGAMAFWIVHS